MIAEAIAKIAELAKAGQRTIEPEIHEISPRLRYLAHGKDLTPIDYEPNVRNASLGEIEDIATFIALADDPAKASIWIGHGALTVYLDDGERLDQATMTLLPSEPFNELEAKRSHPQKLMIQMLRVEKFGALSPDLLGPISTLKWQKTSGGHAEVSHGRESMGREVEANVTNPTAEIPERVTCYLPVFANPALSWASASVECEVILDTESERLGLLAKTGALQAAWRSGRMQLQERINALLDQTLKIPLPVIMGAPQLPDLIRAD